MTVSLDALDDRTFADMNDVAFPVARVIEAIDAAAAAGLEPVKINMVVNAASTTTASPRWQSGSAAANTSCGSFEYVDVGTTNGWRMDDVVRAAEIAAAINARWPLESQPNYRGEVANRYRHRDGAGEIGMIASVTQPFCGACTRARLSADGKLYTCLFATRGDDLRALVRGETSDEELSTGMRSIWVGRADRSSELRHAQTEQPAKIEMSYVGG